MRYSCPSGIKDTHPKGCAGRSLPVVVHKRDLLAACQGESVPRGLVPVDVIHVVGAVVVAGDDHAAHQLLGALVLEAVGVLLVDAVPATRRRCLWRCSQPVLPQNQNIFWQTALATVAADSPPSLT